MRLIDVYPAPMGEQQRQPTSVKASAVPESFNNPNRKSAIRLDDELIGKEELRRRLNLPSIRMVEQLMRKRKIPYLRLGHKTVRFSWTKVLEALARFEHRAVGQ
jgi:hypothetical protein